MPQLFVVLGMICAMSIFSLWLHVTHFHPQRHPLELHARPPGV